MFEKLLLASTITVSLNFFIGMGAQSTAQPAAIVHAAPHSIYVAQVLHDNSFLRNLFQ